MAGSSASRRGRRRRAASQATGAGFGPGTITRLVPASVEWVILLYIVTHGEPDSAAARDKQTGAAIAHAVREALSSVLAGENTELVLAYALRLARIPRLPSDGAQLHGFVTGPLHEAIEALVGAAEATQVVGELRAVFGLSSGRASALEVLSEPPSEPRSITLQPPSTGDDDTQNMDSCDDSDVDTAMIPNLNNLRVVLFSSDDRARRRLSEWLPPIARVVAVQQWRALVDALHATSPAGALLVLDCRNLDQGATLLATIAPDLRPGAPVVLWGSPSQTQRQLDYVQQPRSEWIRCESEAEPEDLAALIQSAMARKG